MRSHLGFYVVVLIILALLILVTDSTAQQQYSPGDGARPEWSSTYSSQMLDGESKANCVVTDSLGNVYVGGSIDNVETARDYLIIKYNAAGQKMWQATYDGDGHGLDVPTAIALDGQGNVLVTGMSMGDETDYDFATIKYNANGQQLWVKRFDGNAVALNNDIPIGLALDGAGNVLVVGKTNSYYGIVTIKYDALGNELWIQRYGDPNTVVVFSGFDLDGSGNSYSAVVQSRCDNNWVFSRSWIIMKHNPNGQLIWTATFLKDTAKRYDEPSCQVGVIGGFLVTPTGEVYISGMIDSSLHDSIVTLKYSSNGNPEWTASRLAPSSSSWSLQSEAGPIVSDGRGNIVATDLLVTWEATFGYRTETVTRKYDSRGREMWSHSILPPPNKAIHPHSVSVDPFGEISVVGWQGSLSSRPSSLLVYKLNSAGVQMDTTRFAISNCDKNDFCPRLTMDTDGTVYMAGSTPVSGGVALSLKKFSSSGVEVWSATELPGSQSEDIPIAMKLDGDGNAYVVGESKATDKTFDVVTMKLNSSGQQLWSSRFSMPGRNHELPQAMALDSLGNVYVTGTIGKKETYSQGLYRDSVFIIKYNSTGRLLWTATYSHPSGFVEVHDIAVDVDGNVIVAGVAGSPWAHTNEMFMVKYSSDGVHQWIVARRSYGCWKLAIDRSGKLFVVVGDSAFGGHSTIKYNRDGMEEWSCYIPYPGSTWGLQPDIELDINGSVYSLFWGSLAKLSNSGSLVFTKGNVASFALDSSGCIYIRENAGTILKYSTDATLLWSYVPNTTQQWAQPIVDLGLEVGRDGSVFFLEPENQFFSVSTVKMKSLNSNGTFRWSVNFDFSGARDNYPHIFDTDRSGNLFVAAASYANGSSSIRVTKYVQTVTSVNYRESKTPQTFSLAQNYPNPFNPTTIIAYELPQASNVKLKLFDILGREVETLVERDQNAGHYEFAFDASRLSSGTYFYRLDAGAFVQTRKMLIVR